MGELWLAGPDSIVATDRGERRLDELAAELGETLVGSRGMALLGPRFPLITKLIDAADWLSLQVHPDDALARELYGPSAVGKTEAWLVVDATPGAELVTGPAHGADERVLRAAITAGTTSHEHCLRRPAVAGESMLVHAGTLHAIGAGAFVYEIEQPSDLTFRISDWGRPTGRILHVAEALRALRPELHAEPCGEGFRLADGALEVEAFRLELPDLARPARRAPGGRSLEVVTAIRGTLGLAGDGWTAELAPYETLVVPACEGEYSIEGSAGAIACVGSLP
ncbi:MAG TPA: type I phosphomannose isomerase catalytic subunit [Myxococcaceae bacterium]|nr:type I phosphomannose isomerase catalytic subunit [Myxococcaceae bacterium]